MRIVSRIGKAREVAASWCRTYYQRDGWNEYGRVSPAGLTKEQIYKGLLALGDNPNPDDVDATIGNTSWTRVCCDECGCSCEEAIEVGQACDYDSNTAVICRGCLLNAIQLK